MGSKRSLGRRTGVDRLASSVDGEVCRRVCLGGYRTSLGSQRSTAQVSDGRWRTRRMRRIPAHGLREEKIQEREVQ